MPNKYWGKRSGGYYEPKRPKGHPEPWGLVINIKRKGSSGTGNNAPKRPAKKYRNAKLNRLSKQGA